MKLEGITVNFLGDSITEGCGVTNCSKNRYDNVLKELCGLGEIRNFGIGGTRLAYQTKVSGDPKFDLLFCGRAKVLPPANLTVVFGGTNDYGHGDAPFGTPDDTTPATFCGAVNFLMKEIRRKLPDTTLVFMTPCHRRHDDNPSPANARPLVDYVDAIVEAGKRHGIPVLDLYRNLGIDPNTSEEDYLRYMPDGLHLNDGGHHVIAKCLAEFLKAL